MIIYATQVFIVNFGYFSFPKQSFVFPGVNCLLFVFEFDISCMYHQFNSDSLKVVRISFHSHQTFHQFLFLKEFFCGL